MPSRIIREGIITSVPVNSLSWPAELFYRRLMSIADDFGRYFAHPKLLRAALYPLQLEKVSDSDIGKFLLECEKAGLVRVYSVQDGQYLELCKFNQQVRAKSSKYPCLADDAHVRTKAHSESETNAKTKASIGLTPDLDVEPLRTAWADFLAHRAQLRAKPLTEQGIKLKFSEFREWGIARSAAAIRHSIKSNWQGIFEPKGDAAPKRKEKVTDDEIDNMKFKDTP